MWEVLGVRGEPSCVNGRRTWLKEKGDKHPHTNTLTCISTETVRRFFHTEKKKTDESASTRTHRSAVSDVKSHMYPKVSKIKLRSSAGKLSRALLVTSLHKKHIK